MLSIGRVHDCEVRTFEKNIKQDFKNSEMEAGKIEAFVADPFKLTAGETSFQDNKAGSIFGETGFPHFTRPIFILPQ